MRSSSEFGVSEKREDLSGNEYQGRQSEELFRASRRGLTGETGQCGEEQEVGEREGWKVEEGCKEGWLRTRVS